MIIVTAIGRFVIAPKLPLTGPKLPLTASKLSLTLMATLMLLMEIWILLMAINKQQFAVKDSHIALFGKKTPTEICFFSLY